MRYIFLFVILTSISASGQALRDLNYSFLYNPNEPVSFDMYSTKSGATWTTFYKLTLNDTTLRADQFLIQWDFRKDLSEKEGTPVSGEDILKTTEDHSIVGSLSLPVSAERQILVAKVFNNSAKRAWLFHEIISQNYPVNGYLKSGETAIVQPFIKANTSVTIEGYDGSKILSYYNDDFPAAAPGFSEGLGKVRRSMLVDSTIIVDGGPVAFSETGLYLVQKDTNATEGFAFRVEDDYPRLAKIESLADPLIYICTKQEFDRIKEAKGDKKAFDRVIISITKDTERARDFMRSYFRRVELANQYFTSYKEGWKTDRGMIYIVFGLPDQVYKFNDREVWTYKNNTFKITFDFVKSSTLFDPENFVLIREKKFQETWYEVIDLWRKARF